MPLAQPRPMGPLRAFTPPLGLQLRLPPRPGGRAPARVVGSFRGRRLARGKGRGRGGSAIPRPSTHIGFFILMFSVAGTLGGLVGVLRNMVKNYKLRRNRGQVVEVQASPKFMSNDDLKDTVKKSLEVHQYDVHEFYHTKGIWQRIARSHNFEVFTLAMVAFNSAWIAIDMDFNRCPILAMSHPIFRIMEEIFTFYFVSELFIRFRAFKKKSRALRDGWFVFDAALCFLMVLENWVLEIILHLPGVETVGNSGLLQLARLLKLLRMARMARLFQAMPELLILVRGMVAATRSVGTTLTLLFILLYVYALAFRSLTMGIPVLKDLYFGSVPGSMYTLLIRGIFMDNLGDAVSVIGQHSWPAAMLFWGFVLTSSLTVMNMLIAVICEAVNSVAATEKEAHQVAKVTTRLRAMLDEMDHEKAQEGKINEEEFLLLLQRPDCTQLMLEVGVDPIALVDHADAMFIAEDVETGHSAEREMDFDEFAQLILSLRSSCRATVKDIIDLRKFTRTIVAQTNDHLTRIETKLDRLGILDGDGLQPRQLAPVPAVPERTQEQREQKATMVASMLARAQALSSKLQDTGTTGADVSTYASRAKELRNACDMLRGSKDDESR